MRKDMKTILVNPEKCIGCKHCEIACIVEHSKSKNLFSAISETPALEPHIYVETGVDFLSFPNKCRHCDPAPCVQVCPTEALYRDEDSDSVLIDSNKCIACGMCMIVCPFGVIQFKKDLQIKIDKEVSTKCDSCIERQKEGKEPACVEACKAGALIFGEANELIKSIRKDFTLRVTKAPGAEIEIPALPLNIKMWRDLLKGVEQVSTFEEKK